MDAVSCWAVFPSQALLWGGQEGFLHFKPCGRVPLVAVGLRPQTLLCHWVLQLDSSSLPFSPGRPSFSLGWALMRRCSNRQPSKSPDSGHQDRSGSEEMSFLVSCQAVPVRAGSPGGERGSFPAHPMWFPALGVPGHPPAGLWTLCCARDLCREKLSVGDSRVGRATGEQAGKCVLR